MSLGQIPIYLGWIFHKNDDEFKDLAARRDQLLCSLLVQHENKHLMTTTNKIKFTLF